MAVGAGAAALAWADEEINAGLLASFAQPISPKVKQLTDNIPKILMAEFIVLISPC